MIIAIICALITVLASIGLITVIKSNKLKFYNTKLKEAEKELQELFEKKLSLLTQIQNKLIEQNSELEFNLLCDIDDIKDDDFMLNAILNKANKEIHNFLEEKHNYIPDDEVKELLLDLYNTDIECKAIKNYYNENAIIINNKLKNFSNSTIAKFNKINTKEIYNDPIEEEFEILKKK